MSELTKYDYNLLIDLLEREMDQLRLPAWYGTYKEYKRLKDKIIFLRDKEDLNEN